MSSFKAPFHQVNGQQPNIQKSPTYSSEDEIRKFIHDSWIKVCKEIEVPKIGLNGKVQTVAFYNDLSGEQLPCPGFKPFDLNSFLDRQRSVYLHNNRPVSQ